jgi:hypothetical protein
MNDDKNTSQRFQENIASGNGAGQNVKNRRNRNDRRGQLNPSGPSASAPLPLELLHDLFKLHQEEMGQLTQDRQHKFPVEWAAIVEKSMDVSQFFIHLNQEGLPDKMAEVIPELWFLLLLSMADHSEKDPVGFLHQIAKSLEDLGRTDSKSDENIVEQDRSYKRYPHKRNRSESPQRMLTSLLKSEEVVRRPLGDVLQ